MKCCVVFRAYKTHSSGLWHEVILPTVYPRVAQCEGRGVTEHAEGGAWLWIHPTQGKCQRVSEFEIRGHTNPNFRCSALDHNDTPLTRVMASSLPLLPFLCILLFLVLAGMLVEVVMVVAGQPVCLPVMG
ncbi:hypothetical protein E2C01_046810 [Portunus trituberculatus]|uniref:Uncharacterized protein n=1 Tax=Portunus trituberculatus TaxID=210409 RepID=A0A5B7G5U1_PORTR|nr:hypothetical protein [Portunus trituberculatus]